MSDSNKSVEPPSVGPRSVEPPMVGVSGPGGPVRGAPSVPGSGSSNVGPKAQNRGAPSTGHGPPPEPGAVYQDPGLEKGVGEVGRYVGDALGQLAGSALGPAGSDASGNMLGTLGAEFGQVLGEAVGAAGDAMFGYWTPGGDGGMSVPEVGAGMSLPQGASVDADQGGMSTGSGSAPEQATQEGSGAGMSLPQGASVDADQGGMSMPPE